jgi:hypothetical protein
MLRGTHMTKVPRRNFGPRLRLSRTAARISQKRGRKAALLINRPDGSAGFDDLGHGPIQHRRHGYISENDGWHCRVKREIKDRKTKQITK